MGAAWDNPFSDVNESDWFYGDVMYAFANGIFRGTTEDMFEPDLPITRGMLVTALGRQNGVNEDGYAGSGFDDVDAGMYYAPYIEWARQNGIVLGVGDNRFEPDAPVTRQDIAAIFARFAEYKGIALADARGYTGFADQAEIAGYAEGAVEALYAAEVVNGYPDGSFQPLGEATRAEVAAMLRRLLEAVS